MALTLFVLNMGQKWYQKATVQSAIVGGVLTIVAAFIGLLPYFTNSTEENAETQEELPINNGSVDDFEIEYARLFGGYQVPYLLSNDESNCGYGNGIEQILRGKSRDNFLKNWKFSNAKKIRTKVYEELYSCGSNQTSWSQKNVAFDLLRIANLHDPTVIKYFIHQSSVHHINPGGSDMRKMDVIPGSLVTYTEFMVAKRMPERDSRRIIQNSNRIGFLLCHVKNVTEKTMVDVNFNYLQYDNHSEYPDFPSKNTVENHIVNSTIRTIRLPQIAADDELQFLLAIYLKDDNGYPRNYISSVTRPIGIEYRFQNTTKIKKQDIRLPLKDKVLKIDIPFGWQSQ